MSFRSGSQICGYGKWGLYQAKPGMRVVGRGHFSRTPLSRTSCSHTAEQMQYYAAQKHQLLLAASICGHNLQSICLQNTKGVLEDL